MLSHLCNLYITMQGHSRPRKAKSWLIILADFSAFKGGIPGGLEGVPGLLQLLCRKSPFGGKLGRMLECLSFTYG